METGWKPVLWSLRLCISVAKNSRLPPPIVPSVAFFAAVPGFAAGSDGLEHEGEMFTGGIQAQLARRGQDGVPMQDDNFPALDAREFFEPFAQFNFFAGEELGIEAAEFSERSGFTKDERAGDPPNCPAHRVPQGGEQIARGISGFETDGAAAGQAAAGGDLRGDVVEEFGAWVGVGVDEDEPLAGGGFGAAIARAADLVDGLEDDGGARGARDIRGAVGGVVVAHDEFGLPAAPREGSHGGADLAKGFAQEPFFVKCGDDDGDKHAI
jgi:hypothetical protein